MVDETVTISLNRYNELKNQSDFFNSNYIAVDFEFHNGRTWLKDDLLNEIEKYHQGRMMEYKAKVRSKFTFKFWKWRISIKSIR